MGIVAEVSIFRVRDQRLDSIVAAVENDLLAVVSETRARVTRPVAHGSLAPAVQPKTEYAKRGEVNIAYQVIGDGPLDLLWAPGFVSHVDLYWTMPDLARFLRRLASFSRLIIFDKPGTGASDPVPSAPTLEERVEDIRAVLDAAGSRSAALIGFSEGGPMCLLFAATHPDRVRSLILFGAYARGRPGPGYFDDREEEWKHWRAVFEDRVVTRWGEGNIIEFFAPSVATNAVMRNAAGFLERTSASPAMVRALSESAEQIDVRAILPAIRVPTLVLHRSGDQTVPVEASHHIAEAIPGARLVELAGDDHWPWVGDSERILGEIEQFLTGTRHAVESETVLATVLFTDIVGSTARAAQLGDEAWGELLERHDAIVREGLARYRGREVKATGDGFLAAFDGPARAIRCAIEIGSELSDVGLEIRCGVHTGECVVRGEDLGGLVVHIGSRVGALARAGEVLVSGTVRDLVVGSGIEFDDRGLTELKGVPGQWRIFAVRRAGAQPVVLASDGGETGLPTPHEHLKRSDRLRLRLARRAPGAARAAIRLANRRKAAP